MYGRYIVWTIHVLYGRYDKQHIIWKTSAKIPETKNFEIQIFEILDGQNFGSL